VNALEMPISTKTTQKNILRTISNWLNSWEKIIKIANPK
jgi:hypothetical protein